MVQFNELRVSSDRKYLVIDAQVQELSYYENVTISSIIVDTLKTFSATGPSSKPLFTIDAGNVKRFRDYIDIDGVADNLFFVYVITDGTPAENTPCGMSDTYIMGATYDKYPIYELGMKMLNSIGGCEPSSELIDHILLLDAFNLALKTGNYPKAIEYWDLFFGDTERTINTGCGCYGRIR